MKTKLASVLVAALLGGFSVAAHAAVIDFTADTAGGKPNGFSSTGHPFVTFTDTMGADLSVADYAHQSIGNGLAVFGDDASRLRMAFGGLISSLSLSFGNDDPSFSSAGDRAWLELFNGAASVGLVSVVMDRDDIMNQSISYVGSAFDSALFWYGNATGTPISLIEVVDNIDYGAAAGTPDTGHTAGLAALAMLGLLAARRRLLA